MHGLAPRAKCAGLRTAMRAPAQALPGEEYRPPSCTSSHAPFLPAASGIRGQDVAGRRTEQTEGVARRSACRSARPEQATRLRVADLSLTKLGLFCRSTTIRCISIAEPRDRVARRSLGFEKTPGRRESPRVVPCTRTTGIHRSALALTVRSAAKPRVSNHEGPPSPLATLGSR